MKHRTEAQEQAIHAKGNVLLSAGAGAGKTSTLVQRCLERVLHGIPPLSIDRLLMVTFTEAASAEMRRRLRTGLEDAAAQPGVSAELVAEQLALLDAAMLGTLHSACLRILRENAHALGLDPRFNLLDAPESDTLACQTFLSLIEAQWTALGEVPNPKRDWLQDHAGNPAKLWNTIRHIHQYTRSLPDPDGWIERARQSIRATQPDPQVPSGKSVIEKSQDHPWHTWATQGVRQWAHEMSDLILSLDEAFPNRASALQHLEELSAELGRILHAPHEGGTCCSRRREEAELRQRGIHPPPHVGGYCGYEISGLAHAARILGALSQLHETEAWPKGQAKHGRDTLKELLEGVDFWLSQFGSTSGLLDPLREDSIRVAGPSLALLDLVEEFSVAFEQAKRDRGALDFQDLEQHTLALLWNRTNNSPTSLALEWRARFDEVIVDECQDINAAQNRILQALSREGSHGNLLLVGDVKQSIYRFRLADPRIFLEYEKSWNSRGGAGSTLFLNDNFRSHQRILDFVNAVFSQCMGADMDGVSYPESAHLKPGAPESRPHRIALPGSPCRTSLWIADSKAEPSEGGTPIEDSDTAEPWLAEARHVIAKLHNARDSGITVWDDALASERPMEWGDVAILLRSPRSGGWAFSQAFAEAGIPIAINRESLFETREAMDLLSLLAILDNPLQDIPLLAVLRSPLAELNDTQLALIRAATPQGPFWTALRRFANNNPDLCERWAGSAAAEILPSTQANTVRFLERFDRWRFHISNAPISDVMESILDETAYEPRTRHLPDADPGALTRLLDMARRFDPLRGQGLHRFMKWVELRQESGRETERPSAVPPGAARLISIHKSKGLEFPIVVVAGLGAGFNFENIRGQVLIDEHIGLCLRAQAPHSKSTYPTLPYWLAARDQRAQMMGEELRLLYVAFTRAKDRLFLSASSSFSKLASTAAKPVRRAELLKAQRPLDWIAMAMSKVVGRSNWHTEAQGSSDLVEWSVEMPRSISASINLPLRSPENIEPTHGEIDAWRKRLLWKYHSVTSTREPAKVSVSSLRTRLDETREMEWTPDRSKRPQPSDAHRPDARELGSSTHLILEHLPLNAGPVTLQSAQEVAVRLNEAGRLDSSALDAIDLEAIVSFWNSSLGKEFLEHPENLYRELEFTARWTPEELRTLGLPFESGTFNAEDGFIIVQGIIDLALILPQKIRIVDFKTDRAENPESLRRAADRYEPQLRIYASALSRIYRRPVVDAWLHFLPARQSVAVGMARANPVGVKST